MEWRIVLSNSIVNGISSAIRFGVVCNGQNEGAVIWSSLSLVRRLKIVAVEGREDYEFAQIVKLFHCEAENHENALFFNVRWELLFDARSPFQIDGSFTFVAHIKSECPFYIHMDDEPLTELIAKQENRVEPFFVKKQVFSKMSSFFNNLFFGGFKEQQTQNFTTEIMPPNTFEDFRKMVAVLNGEDFSVLDDNSLEGLLGVANYYQFDCIKGYCIDYIYRTKPLKNAILKYRLAVSNHFDVLKLSLLRRISTSTFHFYNFEKNLRECEMLKSANPVAFEQLIVRYRELCENSMEISEDEEDDEY
ncbi:hypothetical protein niasHS_008078 [Heterodera schachtii]|uniref:BTB domain-containing protein n=2 Tax=Heterodera TaxID=34509 RepID=A0ABD2J7L5_HETSC